MSIKIPDHYKQLRKRLAFDSISIGYASIELAPVKSLDALQQGYGIVPSGDTTDWQDEWVVIGNEGLCGDPIFIDATKEEYPVYTAAHGMGEWSPQLIAPSFSIFAKILEQLQSLARGRTTPVEMERNPLTNKERKAFLKSITRYDSSIDVSFWQSICETGT
ncbi:MAG TPA: hypothetical protein PKA41_07005 [Verrucomicrobiota bacterium]|nr:hypothetical protein [Verrucomicrobiota bacterium]